MLKIVYTLTVLFVLTLNLFACKPLVDTLAFHPDNLNILSDDNLPKEIQALIVTTDDHVRLTSLYLPTKNSKKLLIYFHGNAGNIYHRIPTLLHLQKAGLSVLGVSYRGYGKSEGSPSEDGVYLDGAAVLTYAIEQLGFDEGNIILLGRSIGSTVAVDLAQNKQLAGLILVTPLNSGQEQARSMGLGVMAFLAGDSFNNIEKISNVKSPLMIIHGTGDQVVPFLSGKALFEKATVEKEFIRIDGGGHNDLQGKFAREYWLPIFRFIASL